MKAIGRFFIIIWTIMFTVLGFCGGYILFPLLTYIFTGRCDEPMKTMFNIWDIGKDEIEYFFDNIHEVFDISYIKFNEGFLK